MKLLNIKGEIRSRLLLNYRVQPEFLQALLPSPFRPQLVGKLGIAGICLIRLVGLRPTWLPGGMGISVDGAAHRIAVEWHSGSTVRTGVFVLRRDCASRVIRLLGGRAFPGVHSKASLKIIEEDARLGWSVKVIDGAADVFVEAEAGGEQPQESAFRTVDQAHSFFAAGACGYSRQRSGHRFDGMELCIPDFTLKPMRVTALRSSYFSNLSRFPRGAIEFDSAFVMKSVSHHWQVVHDQPDGVGKAG